MPKRPVDDPDMTLSELMSAWPQTVAVFLRHRMLCVGCLISPFHTIEDACDEYDLCLDAFVEELRASLGEATPRR